MYFFFFIYIKIIKLNVIYFFDNLSRKLKILKNAGKYSNDLKTNNLNYNIHELYFIVIFRSIVYSFNTTR